MRLLAAASGGSTPPEELTDRLENTLIGDSRGRNFPLVDSEKIFLAGEGE